MLAVPFGFWAGRPSLEPPGPAPQKVYQLKPEQLPLTDSEVRVLFDHLLDRQRRGDGCVVYPRAPWADAETGYRELRLLAWGFPPVVEGHAASTARSPASPRSSRGLCIRVLEDLTRRDRPLAAKALEALSRDPEVSIARLAAFALEDLAGTALPEGRSYPEALRSTFGAATTVGLAGVGALHDARRAPGGGFTPPGGVEIVSGNEYGKGVKRSIPRPVQRPSPRIPPSGFLHLVR